VLQRVLFGCMLSGCLLGLHSTVPCCLLLLLLLLQAFGQALWCFAHTLWVGNSFMVTTSLGLMAHHLFGCWHGDRRLAAKYGDAFEKVWIPLRSVTAVDFGFKEALQDSKRSYKQCQHTKSCCW
jgi:hypothetical protein